MKVYVKRFNMVKRSLDLDLQLVRTSVQQQVHVFAVFIFLAYHKAPDVSKNSPIVPTAPNDAPATYIMAGTNPLANKYIIVHFLYMQFFFWCTFFWTEHKTLLRVISQTLDLSLLVPSKHLTFPFLISIYLSL